MLGRLNSVGCFLVCEYNDQQQSATVTSKKYEWVRVDIDLGQTNGQHVFLCLGSAKGRLLFLVQQLKT